jgi:hypothetical protein
MAENPLKTGDGVSPDGRSGTRIHDDFPWKSANSLPTNAPDDARPAPPANLTDPDPVLDRIHAVWDRLTDGDRLALAEHAERLVDGRVGK